MAEYHVSTVVLCWYSNSTRYRLATTRDGRRVIEKVKNGRYVMDHIQ